MKCSICKTGDLCVDQKTGLIGCPNCDKVQSATLEDFLIHFGKLLPNKYARLLIMVATIANRPLSAAECRKLTDCFHAMILSEIAQVILSQHKGGGVDR